MGCNSEVIWYEGKTLTQIMGKSFLNACWLSLKVYVKSVLAGRS